MQKDVRYYLNGLYLECEDPQSKFIIYVMNEEFKVIYAPLVPLVKDRHFRRLLQLIIKARVDSLKKYSNRKSYWGVYPSKIQINEGIDSFQLDS
ncbi:unnamed protein product [Paramecium primaurelia]|uniref:Uncharacterized protein n=1 Tax=Paramecium primaurelia TaxID=5886 RepID=A0A8S1K5P5_PARPR|nr:unnamed protein product [Paramecium primaurelia]